MSTTTITVGGKSVTCVDVPAALKLRSVEFSFSDAVAIDVSPFTGDTQTQSWPGADKWDTTMLTPPTMCQGEADEVIAFLMELRGMANAFQLGDPLKTSPRGALQGSKPLVNTAGGSMAAGGTTLYTRGWTASRFRLLLPGDYLQIGYRLHRNLGIVNSDGDGHAALSIFPSLREVPADGATVVLNNPRGLWRLAQNKRNWSADPTRLTKLSFPIMEYR